MDLSTREGRRVLGDRIKRAAKDAGLSLDDLAVRIGCSRALIYQYASGASLAQPDRLQQIAEVVGRSLSSFFEDSDAVFDATSTDSADASAPVDIPPRDRLGFLRELVDAHSSSPDWRRVADTCQQLVTLLHEESPSEEIARYLTIHGNSLIRLQEFGNAKNKLEEAGEMYRELGMMSESLDCLQSIGGADIHLGRAVQAMAAFRRVAEGTDWRHRWQGPLSIGAVQEMQGDYNAASESLLRAQEIIGEHKDQRVTAAAYLYVDGNWANLELCWADYERALETAQRCFATAQKLGDQDQYIEALLNSATARLGLGQTRLAFVDADSAVNVAELMRDYERWSLGLALRSLAGGPIVDAKEALSIALRYNCQRAEIVAQKAIAIAYLNADNLVEARYHIDQAIATAEAGGLKLPLVEFRALSAQAQYKAGDVDTARATAGTALTDAAALQAKQPQHDAALVLADIAVEAADWPTALTHASTAATIARQMKTTWHLWRSESIRAAALEATGAADQASAAAQVAVESIDEHRKLIIDATGSDLLPDQTGVKEVWLRWFSILENAGRNDDAADFVTRTNWEPLAAWIEEARNVK